MKKYTRMLAVFFILLTGNAQAGVTGDANGDGVVGLPEAVYALQVASGIRPLSSGSTTYDFAEYFNVNNSEYKYLSTFFTGTESTSYTTPITYQYSTKNVQGMNMLVKTDPGIEYYYLIDTDKVVSKGYNVLSSSTFYWYDPPIVIGARKMVIGDSFLTLYKTSPWNPYTASEYTFGGLETVTVPAGTFSDCIKMINKNSTVLVQGSGSSYNSQVSVNYYARNVGMVKSMSTSGFKVELTNAHVGGVSYPTGVILKEGQGTWNKMQGTTLAASGTFNMHFATSPLPNQTMLRLNNFGTGSQGPLTAPTNFYINTEDGVHFSGYFIPGVQPIAPDITLSVQNNSITGVYNYSVQEGNPATTVNYVVQIIGTYATVP